METKTPSNQLEVTTVWIVFALALLTLLLGVLIYFHLTPDDVYITTRYSKHLFEGKGIVFNVGERVEVYSNFSHVLLYAVFYLVGLPIYASIKLWTIVCGFLLLFVNFLTLRKLHGRTTALTLIAVNVPFLFGFILWSTSGLETIPYALLVSVVILGFVSRSSTRRNWLISIVLLLLALTRPEGNLVSILVLLLGVLTEEKAERKRWLIPALTCLVLIACYHLWRILYYGDLLPTPFYFKITEIDWWSSALAYLSPIFPPYVLFPLLILTIAALLHPDKTSKRVSVIGWAIIVVELVLIFRSGGDWMCGGRFVVHFIGVMSVLCAIGLDCFFKRFSILNRGKILLYTGISSLILLYSILELMPSLDRINNLLLPMESHTKNHDLVSSWIRTNTNPDDSIVINEMGYIPWKVDRYYYDWLGLADKDYRYYQDKDREQYIQHLFDLKPDYFIIPKYRGKMACPEDYEVVDTSRYNNLLHNITILRKTEKN